MAKMARMAKINGENGEIFFSPFSPFRKSRKNDKWRMAMSPPPYIYYMQWPNNDPLITRGHPELTGGPQGGKWKIIRTSQRITREVYFVNV